MKSSPSIIYFDGDCGLCSSVVQYIYTRDKKNIFLFAPLQGKTAQKNLDKKYTKQLNTLVLTTGKETYNYTSLHTKSTAALKIFTKLPYHKWMNIFWIIPKPIRDFGYDIVSRIRKKIPTKNCKWNKKLKERILK